jgi:RNA polymerase sigma factor (sigma-70 family)
VKRLESEPVGVVRPAGSEFELFYREYFDPAVRLGWLLCRSSVVAEDLAQDAFIALRGEFDQVRSPAAWVNRAIVNRARTWHRDHERHRRRLQAVVSDRPPLEDADLDLLDAVSRLPYRQRVVVVAGYWGGWTEREIADTLRIRPGTVKSLASRALDQLRQEVDK